MPSKLGRFAEQAEAQLWAEPKCKCTFSITFRFLLN
jgi:hypothetical protein